MFFFFFFFSLLMHYLRYSLTFLDLTSSFYNFTFIFDQIYNLRTLLIFILLLFILVYILYLLIIA